MVRKMTLAFDSPLLVSKATWLYVRPAGRQQRSISASEQQLFSLLERRRKKYLARKESIKDVDMKKEGDGGIQPGARVLSDELEVDNHCTEVGMYPNRSPRCRLRFDGSTVPDSVVKLKTRTRGTTLEYQDKAVKHSVNERGQQPTTGHTNEELCRNKEDNALTRYGEQPVP